MQCLPSLTGPSANFANPCDWPRHRDIFENIWYTRQKSGSSCAVKGVVDKQNFPSDNDSHLTKGLSALGRQESQAPDELTRRRHLTAMQRAGGSVRKSRLLGVAAAVAVLIAGVVITNQGGDDSPAKVRNQVAELQPLKEVKDLTAIPFERSEDYVILDVDSARADDVSDELASVLGTSPAVAGKSSKATTFVVPASAANAITDTTGIVATQDTPMKATAEQLNPPSWGLDRVDATDVALNNSYKYFSTGASSYVYVIDTGVYSGHSDLAGRVTPGYTAISDGRGTEDCNGHGTHVAGTVAGASYGVAKESRIVAVRVLDCAGSGYTSSVIAGINWVIASHPGGAGVINLSLGGGASSAVDTAVANATAAGLTVVVAAGNSSADACSFSPARAPSALTIGAINKGDTQASYSNTGSCVDMWAPGTGITSSWIGGASATNTISGTSMASPHVAGLAARLAQAFPGISSSEITAKLTANKLSALSVTSFAEEPPADTTTTVDPGVTTTVPSIAPTTTAPVVTTVPPLVTTTTVKAPGKKAVGKPRRFAMKYETENGVTSLMASWVDDQTPEMYKLECTRNKDKEVKEDAADSLDAESFDAESGVFISRANVKVKANGRSEAAVVMAPKAKSLCWMIAMIGDAKSRRSNVAVVPKPITVAPVPPAPVVTTTTVPGQAPITTLPLPSTTVAQSSRTTTPPRATTTVAPRPAPAPTTTKAPSTNRGNSGNSNSKNEKD